MSKGNEQVWDKKIQQYHGGQEWKFLKNFVEDFSVTTNGLGAPVSAMEAAKNAVIECTHYPPANQEPAKSSLAKFLWPETWEEDNDRLLLGNGASELIDLIMRLAPKGTWKAGPFAAQYKEYERSATNNGYTIIDSGENDTKANVSCLVNPCNPTGDYMEVDEVLEWILNNVTSGGFAIIDESMQPWHSKDFRNHSLCFHKEKIQRLFSEMSISVYVIHSWTKLWSCTGLRLGSIVCPNTSAAMELKKIQVPWSVNLPALAFLDAATRDVDYLNRTWEVTPKWRKNTVELLNKHFPKWSCHGKEFLSWVWVDTGSTEVATRAVDIAKSAGVPVRSGVHGYKMPTFIRLAVRSEEKFKILLDAWVASGM
ncbi:Histidinol-phosphate aminotransferase 1 [Zancudomyces culisetae]|uniref:Histidinol-phosphate aminotransferase 1 n=1 Tax=Zancudomyces culisetae TaxID=1213189 RepID=A0A1R1PQ96_ZANCU|nr:Histidinol-phosphate aminotransferase 1 [Zancudomyces culisetae]|eukprot:OMH83140.1 Histidinol-phosphate aminotransferase 1 [Zancudomyces culisetae]